MILLVLLGVTAEPVVTSQHWHSRAVAGVAFSPDGGYIVSGGSEGTLVIWQTETKHSTFLPRLGSPIRAVSVSQNVTLTAPLLYWAGLANNTAVAVDAAAMKTAWKHVGLAMSV